MVCVYFIGTVDVLYCMYSMYACYCITFYLFKKNLKKIFNVVQLFVEKTKFCQIMANSGGNCVTVIML